MKPTLTEQAHRDDVYARILDYTKRDERIKLPDFDAANQQLKADYALLAIEANDFSGEVDQYRYQFEGEDDLLHVAVMKKTGETLDVQEAQRVVAFLLPTVSPALIWLRPGTVSHHFYVGHDELS